MSKITNDVLYGIPVYAVTFSDVVVGKDDLEIVMNMEATAIFSLERDHMINMQLPAGFGHQEVAK